MFTSASRVLRGLLVVGAIGCQVSGVGAPVAAPNAPTPPTTGSANVVDQLLLDVAITQACDRLRGKFLSLPDQDNPQMSGAAAGMAAAGGRWLIEECEASAANGSLSLHLGGLSWKWVEQTHYGNRVRQHVYFSATVDLVGSLQLGYDPKTMVATVFMLPRTQANVTPALPVHAEAVNLGGGIIDLFVNADEHARAAVQAEGSSQFRDQLGQGITVTFDVAHAQPDVDIGRLPPGVVPNRPFHGRNPWLLNERQALHPGGLMVAGPFPPGASASVDVVNETGGPMRYRIACSDAVVNDFHGFYRGFAFTPIIQLPDSGWAVPGQRVPTVPVPPQPCAWVLVTASSSAPTADTTVYAAVQVRPGR
jgi:hypothetical protein